MIRLQQLSLQLGSKTLLDHANLDIYPGQKWGVIGANGAGKSSLFKLFLGEHQEDAGELSLAQGWQIAHMAQEVKESDKTALDYVLDGDQELRQLQAEIENCPSESQKLGTLYQKLEDIDAYSAEARAKKLLHGLGFNIGEEDKLARDFSGGWRIRLNLAQALMCRSDLLLLDEPTNHLDLDACYWLESWLKTYDGTLLIISHDRDFLDNIVDNIVNFEGEKLISYKGNYSAYEKQKAERLAQQQASFEKQQARVKEIDAFVRRFRAKASKAKQAQSRLKELERMEMIAPAHIDSPFSFQFPECERMPQTLMTLSEASIGYGQTAIVSNIELNIGASTRLGVLGHNGEGKSTLLKSLSSKLPLVSGSLHTHEHTRLAYYSQHQLEALDLKASAFQHIQRISPKASEQEIRNFLGSFGFNGDRVFEVITHFSGGEKARLALALLAWQKPNLLLLDEPTNHLDLEVRHALTLALQTWNGAIILVSHDRHLLRNAVDEFVLVDQGKMTAFEGDLTDYHHWLLKSAANQSKSAEHDDAGANDTAEEARSADSNPKTKDLDKKAQRQLAAAKRDALRPLTNAIKKLEKQIESLQASLDDIEKQLADESLYSGEKDKLQTLLQEQGNTRNQLDDCEAQWLEKSEELETLQNG